MKKVWYVLARKLFGVDAKTGKQLYVTRHHRVSGMRYLQCRGWFGVIRPKRGFYR